MSDFIRRLENILLLVNRKTQIRI